MNKLLITIITTITMASACQAEVLFKEIKSQGKPVTVTLAPEDSGIDKIYLRMVSKGNMTIPLELGLTGPAGVTIRAQSRALLSGDIFAITPPSEWTDIMFKKYGEEDKPAKKIFTLPGSDTSTGGDPDHCSGLSEEIIQSTISNLAKELKRTVTREEICTSYQNVCSSVPGPRTGLELVKLSGRVTIASILYGRPLFEEEVCALQTTLCSVLWPRELYDLVMQVSQTLGRLPTIPEICSAHEDDHPGLTNDGADLQLTGFVRKNTCQGNAKSRYLINMELDLSSVDPALRATGFDITVTPVLVKFTGKIAGKIKSGDPFGMFANKWILLAAKAGYGEDTINLIKWKNGRIKSSTKVKIGTYGAYRSVRGSRSNIQALLRGGSGVFEIKTDYNSYSMCFDLRRKLQEINWPGPGGY